MAFSPERVTTVTFDSYSTLLDVDSTEEALVDYLDDPDPVARLWRQRSLASARANSSLDDYRPFYETNCLALEDALSVHDVDIDDGECEEILSIYHDLHVLDDVRSGTEH